MQNRIWLGILAGGLALAGCTVQETPIVPSLTPVETGLVLEGKVVSHELATIDVARSKAFYGTVFGWTFQDLVTKPRPYTVVLREGVPIGGMFQFLPKDPGKHNGEWLPMISTANVDAAVEKARAGGATILSEPRDVPHRGRFALVVDPQKAVFFFLRASGGDPRDAVAGINDWIWDELWTSDPSAALGFYGGLFPYQSAVVTKTITGDYHLLSSGGQPRAGVMKLEAADVRPHWVPFIRVADVKETVARAVAAGASVLIEPSQTTRGGLAALLLDPTSAPIIIQEYNP